MYVTLKFFISYVHGKGIDEAYDMWEHLNACMNWSNQCKEQQWNEQHYEKEEKPYMSKKH